MKAFAGLVNEKYKYTMFCSGGLKYNPPTAMSPEFIMRKFCAGNAGWYFFEGTEISNYETQWILVLKEERTVE